jgi:hypothetical protein
MTTDAVVISWCLLRLSEGDDSRYYEDRLAWFDRHTGVSSTVFRTSTEFFKSFVGDGNAKGFLHATFGMLGGGGIPRCESMDPTQFLAGNNAWCVVADQGILVGDEYPLFFTRNIDMDRLRPDVGACLRDVPPWGDDLAIVITRAGQARILTKSDTRRWVVDDFTNRVLRP